MPKIQQNQNKERRKKDGMYEREREGMREREREKGKPKIEIPEHIEFQPTYARIDPRTSAATTARERKKIGNEKGIFCSTSLPLDSSGRFQ